MGIVKTILLATTVLSAFTANAGQEFKAMDNSKASHLCVAAATLPLASFGQLAKSLSPNSMPGAGFNIIANNLYCNGENVVKFAISAGNESVGDKLSMYKKGTISIKDIAYVNHGKVQVTNI